MFLSTTVIVRKNMLWARIREVADWPKNLTLVRNDLFNQYRNFLRNTMRFFLTHANSIFNGTFVVCKFKWKKKQKLQRSSSKWKILTAVLKINAIFYSSSVFIPALKHLIWFYCLTLLTFSKQKISHEIGIFWPVEKIS